MSFRQLQVGCRLFPELIHIAEGPEDPDRFFRFFYGERKPEPGASKRKDFFMFLQKAVRNTIV